MENYFESICLLIMALIIYKFFITINKMENYFEAIYMLIMALIIDLIGMSSYFIPGMGEAFDTAWAPIRKLYFNI